MPIKPNDLNEKRIARSAERLKDVIIDIDHRMEDEYDGDSFTYPSDKLTEFDIKYLKKLYGQYGWELEDHSDQRDGNWLSFTPTTSSSDYYTK